MAISMYMASIPTLKSMLCNLDRWLDLAAAHAQTKKFDPEILLSARLYPDMFAVTRQVQVATEHALGAAARLSEVEVPKYPETETTFGELKERVAKTVAFLDSIRPEQMESSEQRKVLVYIIDQNVEFTGQQYLMCEVWPNFYFHITCAYAILRNTGVELGKPDFLGGIVMRN